MARRLLKKLLKRPDKDKAPAHPLVRLINRVAGVVYPTNASGNNMSVR